MTTREHFETVFNRIKYGVVAIGIAGVVWLTWRYPHLTKLQNIQSSPCLVRFR